MGYGDELMATGMARGARTRGKRIAFGDGRNIIFSPWSKVIFRNNPNIAWPGEEASSDIEWIAHHKGNRLYNRLNDSRTRWVWSKEFRPIPGEMFFGSDEMEFATKIEKGFILVEPNVPQFKSVAQNKDWGADKYRAVVAAMIKQGRRVIQFDYPTATVRCAGAVMLPTPDIRHALAVLKRAALYIGPEGGLHHGAAAVGVPGVVLFGGFIPPSVTGYSTHINLTGGSSACGNLNPCGHCRSAMDQISVLDVLRAAETQLTRGLSVHESGDRDVLVGV